MPSARLPTIVSPTPTAITNMTPAPVDERPAGLPPINDNHSASEKNDEDRVLSVEEGEAREKREKGKRMNASPQRKTRTGISTDKEDDE
jgi:hypothetical protein